MTYRESNGHVTRHSSFSQKLNRSQKFSRSHSRRRTETVRIQNSRFATDKLLYLENGGRAVVATDRNATRYVLYRITRPAVTLIDLKRSSYLFKPLDGQHCKK